MPYWVAVTASTLAETYYETGAMDTAVSTAHKVLRLEKTHTQQSFLAENCATKKGRGKRDETRKGRKSSRKSLRFCPFQATYSSPPGKCPALIADTCSAKNGGANKRVSR